MIENQNSRAQLWLGRILTGFPILFLLLDAVMKIARATPAIEGTLQLGYPIFVVMPLGVILLIATILYAIPKTSVLGAILLTGYLGGAVASHVRMLDPMLSHTLVPVYLGIMIWGGLYLRDSRVRGLLPITKR